MLKLKYDSRQYEYIRIFSISWRKLVLFTSMIIILLVFQKLSRNSSNKFSFPNLKILSFPLKFQRKDTISFEFRGLAVSLKKNRQCVPYHLIIYFLLTQAILLSLNMVNKKRIWLHLFLKGRNKLQICEKDVIYGLVFSNESWETTAIVSSSSIVT